MERDGSSVQVPASASSAPADAAASPREVLAQQLASGNIDRSSIYAQLTSNPFFTAGFGLAALGIAATAGRQTVTRAASLAKRRLLVDVEITRNDESYVPFLRWMTHYTRSQLDPAPPGTGLTSKLLRRFTPGIHHLSVQTSHGTLPNGQEQTHFGFVPGPGRHILRYKNAFLLVKRERDGKAVDHMTGTPFETVTLTTLYRDRHLLTSLFAEAHALAQQATEGKTKIYVPRYLKWEEFGTAKRKRPLDSVTLAEGIKDGVVEDVRTFLRSREWYLDRGIPYRRGYLLYGPPGTGKSSFIQALAGELDFDIAMLNLSERGITDDALNVLLTNIPARTLVLLEDADAAFRNRRQVESDGYAGANVTFSGLLNALDGVASAEERIVFLTTNHIELLDEALVRPGRVDMTVKLDNATESQTAHMWDRFYKDRDADGKLKAQFLDKMTERGFLGKLSTAKLQGLFLFNKDNAHGAIDGMDMLFTKHPVAEDRVADVASEANA